MLNAASNNQVTSNFVGTDTSGTTSIGNLENGILITAGTTGNTIGVADAGNLISGNGLSGVLINNQATQNTVAANNIGTDISARHGLTQSHRRRVDRRASNNVIGNTDAVSGIDYFNADSITLSTSEGPVAVSGWQGLRNSDTPGQYLMTGTAGSNGLLYDGTMDGSSGTAYAVNDPLGGSSSAYGADNLSNGGLSIVGTYRTSGSSASTTVNSFLFQGTTAQLGDSGNYKTIDYPGAMYTYAHSVMNDLVVGNFDNPVEHGDDDLPFGPGNAFIYSISQNKFVTSFQYPGAETTSAYGIWYNGGTSYTIVGGYSPNRR